MAAGLHKVTRTLEVDLDEPCGGRRAGHDAIALLEELQLLGEGGGTGLVPQDGEGRHAVRLVRERDRYGSFDDLAITDEGH